MVPSSYGRRTRACPSARHRRNPLCLAIGWAEALLHPFAVHLDATSQRSLLRGGCVVSRVAPRSVAMLSPYPAFLRRCCPTLPDNRSHRRERALLSGVRLGSIAWPCPSPDGGQGRYGAVASPLAPHLKPLRVPQRSDPHALTDRLTTPIRLISTIPIPKLCVVVKPHCAYCRHSWGCNTTPTREGEQPTAAFRGRLRAWLAAAQRISPSGMSRNRSRAP